jgi:hypothetical protein
MCVTQPDASGVTDNATFYQQHIHHAAQQGSSVIASGTFNDAATPHYQRLDAQRPMRIGTSAPVC